MDRLTRREFARRAGGLGLAAGLASGRVLGANERVSLGFIGVGNRGEQLLNAFLTHADAAPTALCDVYRPYLEFAAAAVRKVRVEPRTFHDFRQILELPDIDAVIIATPDHWHAIQFIDACRAGKDVYVEKPLALTIAEGRRMVEVAEATKRITLMGVQRRSAPAVQKAVQVIRSGGIGKVTFARCYHVQNEMPLGIGPAADGEPPPGLDWDLWLGPAPRVPYNANRCHYKFRWFWDYSGGQLTNFGTHYLDVIQWALGQDAPRRIAALGGKFVVPDNREIPDTLEVTWLYDGPALVTFTQINANGAAVAPEGDMIEFRGTLGALYTGYGGFQVIPEKLQTYPFPTRNPLDRKVPSGTFTKIEPMEVEGSIRDADHARHFLDCVKSRAQTNCDVRTGHRSTTATLLGNIALKANALLAWDAKAERVTNVPEANRYLSYEYRAPWKLG